MRNRQRQRVTPNRFLLFGSLCDLHLDNIFVIRKPNTTAQIRIYLLPLLDNRDCNETSAKYHPSNLQLQL